MRYNICDSNGIIELHSKILFAVREMWAACQCLTRKEYSNANPSSLSRPVPFLSYYIILFKRSRIFSSSPFLVRHNMNISRKMHKSHLWSSPHLPIALQALSANFCIFLHFCCISKWFDNFPNTYWYSKQF